MGLDGEQRIRILEEGVSAACRALGHSKKRSEAAVSKITGSAFASLAISG